MTTNQRHTSNKTPFQLGRAVIGFYASAGAFVAAFVNREPGPGIS